MLSEEARAVPTRMTLPDGTSWPAPAHMVEVGWRLRYGEPSKSDLLVAAGAISTLLHLYEVPDAAKHLPMIRRALGKSADETGAGR